MLDKYLQASAGYSADTLSQNDRTSLAMLRERLTLAKDFYSGALFETSRMLPIDQFQGRHSEFAADAAGSGAYPFKTTADYDRQLDRADAFATWTDDAMMRMREGVKAGVVLPRMIVQRILPQLRAHFGLPPAKTEFWQPLANFPAAVAPADRARLEKAYARQDRDRDRARIPAAVRVHAKRIPAARPGQCRARANAGRRRPIQL